MRKLLSLLVALTLAVTCLSFAAMAEEETVTINIMGYERQISDSTSMQERDTQKTWQAYEKVFNDNGIAFNFEIVADRDQYVTTIQTRLASNYDLPDVCCLSTLDEPTLLDLADMGIILPMNEILEITKGAAYEFFYNGEGRDAKNMLTTEDGNFYWLPRIQMNMLEGKYAGTSMGMCIRLDWLNKLGLEVPKTLDEFTDALRAFQENDMNGNGLKDEVLLCDTSVFGNGLDYWFGMVNDSVGVNVTDGTVESPWYSPVLRDYFTYIQTLVNEGLIYVDSIGTDSSTNQLLLDNKVAACYYYPIGTYQEASMIAAGVEDPIFIGIEPITAAEGVHPFLSEETPYLVYLRYGVTNAASDKLESIAKMFDILYSEEVLTIADWGIEGVHYKVNEDGSKTRLIINGDFESYWLNGDSTIDYVARNFFPTIYHNDRANEIDCSWPEKAAYEYATNGYPYITPNDNSSYYAIATPEEQQVLSTYLTDLKDYSRELAADLSLGRASLDDLDSYIETLKSLGLDDVIAVRQAQLDRRNGK